MIPRERWLGAGAWFAGILAVCSLPFFIADPGAFIDDTVKYGAGTYKIVGYGLSAILIRAGILEDREGSYPFVLFALLLWLPLTVWLLFQQRRSTEALDGSGGLRHLDPGAPVRGAHLQQLLPRLARYRRRRCLLDRSVSAYRYERPVRYTRFESATTGLAYFPWLSRQRTRPVRVL